MILMVSDTFSLLSEAADMLVTCIECDDVVHGALTLNYTRFDFNYSKLTS